MPDTKVPEMRRPSTQGIDAAGQVVSGVAVGH